MKPKLINVVVDGMSSFRVNDEIIPHFYNPLHFHPELELTCILKSKGTRFVGHHVESFQPGDLVLVGPNVPHCWKNGPEYYHADPLLEAQAIVVQFREDFAGPAFFDLPELLPVKKLIYDSRRGIKVYGKSREKIKARLEMLPALAGVSRMTCLLEILEMMALSKEKISLTEIDPHRLMPPVQMKRLNDVYQYTLDNFRENIDIEQIAQVANMTPNAFCRFFKSHNRRTYTQFINEVRIAHACSLLSTTSLSITEIAYESGFNNLAHFNRMFRKHRKVVPFSYRKQQLDF